MKDRRCPYRIVKAEGKPDEFGKCYATGCPYFVEDHYDHDKCVWVHEHCRKVEQELAQPKLLLRGGDITDYSDSGEIRRRRRYL